MTLFVVSIVSLTSPVIVSSGWPARPVGSFRIRPPLSSMKNACAGATIVKLPLAASDALPAVSFQPLAPRVTVTAPVPKRAG